MFLPFLSGKCDFNSEMVRLQAAPLPSFWEFFRRRAYALSPFYAKVDYCFLALGNRILVALFPNIEVRGTRYPTEMFFSCRSTLVPLLFSAVSPVKFVATWVPY